MTENTPQLILTKHGYWTYEPKPSVEELADYYAKKYYQEGCGSYSVDYSDEEISYFQLKASLIFLHIKRSYQFLSRASLVDIGCGEGWLMDRFAAEGFDVKGVDFSAYAIKKFHPRLEPFFEQGNIYEVLNCYLESGCSYDIAVIANVIEHVIDPAQLLAQVKKILKPSGILVIVAPNDFSPLQKELLEKKYIEEPFWLTYPEHLSYFNKDSMSRLLKDQGYRLDAAIADNPIDLNLFNDNSNYVRDKAKGKATHFFRVRTDNFLAKIGIDKLLDLYTVLGSAGVGRDLTYFCRKE